MHGDDSAKDAESEKMCRLSKNELIQQNCAVSVQVAEPAKSHKLYVSKTS